jgi:hypothetical protein
MDRKTDPKPVLQQMVGLPPGVYKKLAPLAKYHNRPMGREVDYLIDFYTSQMGEGERAAYFALLAELEPVAA